MRIDTALAMYRCLRCPVRRSESVRPSVVGARQLVACAARWQRRLVVTVSVLFASVITAQLAGFTAEQIESLRARYGTEAAERIAGWDALLTQTGGLAESQKLERVNTFFNRLRFVEDHVHWGRPDYWATPAEFVGTGAGDCEDFSIAKYFTLKRIGIPEEKLRITYVKALNQPLPAHMVLAYYETPDADPLILDNLIKEIRSGSQRTDLAPVYSFNGEGLWMAVAKSRGRKVGVASPVAWTDLLSRMERERTLDLGQTTSR